MIYNLGTYIPGNSPIHRLDPRVKIVSLIIFSLIVFRSGFAAVLPVSTLLIAVVCLAGMSFRQVLQALRPVMLFFLLIFLLHLFFTPGRELAGLPGLPVSVTYEGLATGSLLTWRFVSLIISAAVLTSTTMPSDLVSGIEMLLRPLRIIGVSSNSATTMLSLALRFFPTLIGEYERVKTAMAARGMDFRKGGLIARLRKVSSLAVPLTLNSFLRAEEVAAAMEARGYSQGRRTSIRELRFRAADYGAIALILAFSLFLQILI